MIAPLSLSNLLTVLIAFACYVTATRQGKGGVVRISQLAAPAVLAAVQAYALLAGEIEASWYHDLEWLGGVLLGGFLGHLRGWRLSISADHKQRMILLPPTRDSQAAALALVVVAGIDFVGAFLRKPVADPGIVACVAAFLAGYLVCRALSVAARVEQQARRALRR